MQTEVQHLVEIGAAYPVVRLSGVLDVRSAPVVRSALLDMLARQPEAIVIDVSDLRVPDASALAVLGDVARDTADWPAAHLALCAPEGVTLWRTTGLPVWPSRAAAFADLGEPDTAQHLSLDLEPAPGAARRSRELVTEACARWDLPGLAGPACIVITEMVNNVVVHARTSMTVLLALHGDAMAVAVRDHSAAMPQFTGPVAPTSCGGRGLLLIDSVAERWGSLRLDGGKVVWAMLQREDEPLPPAGRHRHSASMADRARG